MKIITQCKREAYERLGTTILHMVKILKEENKLHPQAMFTEQYLLDEEFDIKIMVSLLPKKTQKQHGEEMFNGE